PFLFKRFNTYYRKGKKIKFDVKEVQKKMFQEYIRKLEGREFYNLPVKIQRQAMWFMKGIAGVTDLRREISQTKDIDEIKRMVEEF
ncbi:MAG: hypothetical protein ACOC1P_06810, partial [Minisyncoccales bacterium]